MTFLEFIEGNPKFKPMPKLVMLSNDEVVTRWLFTPTAVAAWLGVPVRTLIRWSWEYGSGPELLRQKGATGYLFEDIEEWERTVWSEYPLAKKRR